MCGIDVCRIKIDLKCYKEFGRGRKRESDHESTGTWNSREKFQGRVRDCWALKIGRDLHRVHREKLGKHCMLGSSITVAN